MGLATIDPHTCSHKVQTKLYEILKFGVNKPNSIKHDRAIESVKIYKEMYGHPDVVQT